MRRLVELWWIEHSKGKIGGCANPIYIHEDHLLRLHLTRLDHVDQES